MKTISVSAYFDGEKIILDETVSIPPNTRLIVTVLPDDIELQEWYVLSKKRLSDAYAEEEEEYSLDLIKEPNPKYERR
jgi:hypothetical protein